MSLALQPTLGFIDTGNFVGNIEAKLIACKDLQVDGETTFDTNLTVNGNSVLGNASGDTLTVNATSTFAAAASFNDAVTLGNASGDAITVTGTPTFATQVTITPTTNQLRLGVTNTTTISSTAPSASRTYTIPDAGASCNIQLGLSTVVTATLDSTTTLTAADSGKTIYCGQSTTNNDATHNAIILPAPTAGFRLKVIFTAAGDNTVGHGWQVTSTGANMSGLAYGVAGGIVGVSAAGVTNLIRHGTAANTKAGDTIEIHSNGTSHFYTALSSGTATCWSTS
jgi:hypothetical protein